MMRLNSSRRGTLFIDFIAATGIFLLVTGMFYSICARKDRSLNDTEILAHAASEANARMETLRALPRDELLKRDGGTFPVSGLKDPGKYAGKIAIKEFESGLTQIMVTVTWMNRAGNHENVQLSTLVRGGEEWR
ncbi:MAG: hypothetical protein ACYS8W_06880 [Planctomycetota bacterium]|jgi:hypothetical protein